MPYGSALMGILGAGGGNNLVTTLYTGTSAARSLVTGQNLAAGSLIVGRDREGTSGRGWYWFDTERGATNYLQSNSTNAQATDSSTLTSFNSNGFSLGSDTGINQSGKPEVVWSFLKKAGFMDVVEYSGDETIRTISHNLGTDVGAIFTKRTDGASAWVSWHKELGNDKYLVLNSDGASSTSTTAWNNTAPTTSQFTLGASALANATGFNHVALIFAHNPAKKIFCGSFTTDSSGNATVTGLGFSPKLIDLKRTDAAGDWHRLDEKRGFDKQLKLNSSDAESTVSYLSATSDGFTLTGYTASATGIFMAAG